MTEKGTVTDYLIITEHQIPPLPNQDHLPFWEKEWIAPELKELLFGQPGTGNGAESNSLRTYLIVDAYLYTKIRGFFDLDLIDEIPIQCLFKGKAEKDMKTVAPYLVDMTLSEDAWANKNKVPDFHEYYFDKQYNRGTGIFVRSTADMDTVHRHFRKFTKVRDENGKWYFFRFWDNHTVADLQQGLLKNTLFYPLFSENIDQLFFTTAEKNTIHKIESKLPINKTFLFSQQHKEEITLQHQKHYILVVFKKHFPDLLRTLKPVLQDEFAEEVYKKFSRYRVKKTFSKEILIIFCIVFGTQFEKDYVMRQAQRIISNLDEPCYIRMTDLKNWSFQVRSKIYGDHFENYRAALISFSRLSFDTVLTINTKEALIDHCTRLFPQKSSYLGMDGQQVLYNYCHYYTESHQLGFDVTVLIYALCFMLGMGCIDDPLHDYIRTLLNKHHQNVGKPLFDYSLKRINAQINALDNLRN